MKNLINPKSVKAYTLLKLLCNLKDGEYSSHLAKTTDITFSHLSRLLILLENSGVIKINKIGRINRISVNVLDLDKLQLASNLLFDVFFSIKTGGEANAEH